MSFGLLLQSNKFVNKFFSLIFKGKKLCAPLLQFIHWVYIPDQHQYPINRQDSYLKFLVFSFADFQILFSGFHGALSTVEGLRMEQSHSNHEECTKFC